MGTDCRFHRVAIAVGLAAVLGAGLPVAAQVPAVMYHAHANLGYVRDNFTAHLDYLAANSFSTVTLDQFYDWRVNDGILPYRPIMLTVDDNYIQGYTEMYPLLAARGMVATNYTHTRGIGIGSPKASWQQVTEMDSAGVFLVEAHTQTHPRLSTITGTQVRQEVVGSRQDIASNVGGKVSNHFAYPYGDYNAAVITELQAAGFQTGMTTKTGLNTRATPLFELRRWGGDGKDLTKFLADSGLGTLPPPPPGPGWVLDDADPAALPRGAAWTSLSSSSAYQGRSLVGTSGSASTVRWAAHLPEVGTMNVYARWSATTDRAANATYAIDAADGRHLVTVDQRSRGGEWVALGSYSFAAGQAAIITLSGAADAFGGAVDTLGGAAGTLSADAVWFEPLATLVLDRGNALAGPVTIDAGRLLVTDPAAMAAASRLAVAAEAMLDVSGLPGGYQVPTGQTISGNGTIAGSVVFGRGSTLSPGLNSAAPSSRAVPAVPVPEPSGVAIVVLAVAAGVACGRRVAASVRTG